MKTEDAPGYVKYGICAILRSKDRKDIRLAVDGIRKSLGYDRKIREKYYRKKHGVVPHGEIEFVFKYAPFGNEIRLYGTRVFRKIGFVEPKKHKETRKEMIDRVVEYIEHSKCFISD